jgi:hypothetical protein
MIEFSNLKEMPKALSKLQVAVKNPNRNKKAYNYFYADMDEVLNCVKKPCSENGFSIVQMPFNDGEVLGVETMLIHDSGEYIKGKFGSKLSKQDPQSVGSQVSYYRRYSLLSMFNLSQEDDDGASVSKSTAKPTASNPVHVASEKAKKFLHTLILEKNVELTDALISSLKTISSKSCSDAIQALQSHDINKFNSIVKG